VLLLLLLLLVLLLLQLPVSPALLVVDEQLRGHHDEAKGVDETDQRAQKPGIPRLILAGDEEMKRKEIAWKGRKGKTLEGMGRKDTNRFGKGGNR